MKTLFFSDRITDDEGKQIAVELTELKFIDTSEGLKIVATPKPGQDIEGDFSVTIPAPLDYHSRPKKMLITS